VGTAQRSCDALNPAIASAPCNPPFFDFHKLAYGAISAKASLSRKSRLLSHSTLLKIVDQKLESLNSGTRYHFTRERSQHAMDARTTHQRAGLSMSLGSSLSRGFRTRPCQVFSPRLAGGKRDDDSDPSTATAGYPADPGACPGVIARPAGVSRHGSQRGSTSSPGVPLY
jgi:hypothetical protein